MKIQFSATHRRVALAASIALILTGCSNSQKQASVSQNDNGVLRIGILGTTGKPTGPDGWGNQRGLLLPTLKAAGITQIKYFSFAHGPNINEALVANAIDVAQYSDTPAIIGHAAGIPTRLVNQTAVGNNAWLIVRADGPKTVEDLKGKTVGTAKGTAWSRYLIGLLTQKRLINDVKIVQLPSDYEPALTRGDIAAYAGGSGPLSIQHGFRVIDEAAQHPDLQGTSVTVVTEKYLAAHPQFPEIWNKAHRVAVDDLLAHPTEYYQFESAASKQDPHLIEKTSPATRYTRDAFTDHGLALLTGTKDFLVSQHLAKQNFSVQDWIVKNSASPQVSSAANLNK